MRLQGTLLISIVIVFFCTIFWFLHSLFSSHYFSYYMDMDSNNNINKVNHEDGPLTLGNLFHQDLKNANILSNYPTSFVKDYRFLNDKKYRIFDIQKGPKKNNPFLYLYPGRICSIAGNEFPILMDKAPVDELMAHWKRWLPEFPEPEFKTIDEGIEDEDPIITIFPMQRIPKEKHAIEPEMHYHVSISKYSEIAASNNFFHSLTSKHSILVITCQKSVYMRGIYHISSSRMVKFPTHDTGSVTMKKKTDPRRQGSVISVPCLIDWMLNSYYWTWAWKLWITNKICAIITLSHHSLVLVIGAWYSSFCYNRFCSKVQFRRPELHAPVTTRRKTLSSPAW